MSCVTVVNARLLQGACPLVICRPIYRKTLPRVFKSEQHLDGIRCQIVWLSQALIRTVLLTDKLIGGHRQIQHNWYISPQQILSQDFTTPDDLISNHLQCYCNETSLLHYKLIWKTRTHMNVDNMSACSFK